MADMRRRKADEMASAAGRRYQETRRGGQPQPKAEGLLEAEPDHYNTTPQELAEDDEQRTVRVLAQPVGVYGWRKSCLYASVILLLALCIVNLGLLVWLASVLELDDDHAGPLYFTKDKLQVRGQAEFTESLALGRLTGADGAALRLESNSNIRLTATGANDLASELVVDQGETTLTTSVFRAAAASAASNGTAAGMVAEPYFEASEDRILLRANEVRVSSASGMAVEGAVQTSVLQNDFASGRGLTLQSAGQSLSIEADDAATLTSTNGDVTLSSLLDLSLSAGGDLILSANQRLRILELPTPAADAGASEFQLCLCAADSRVFRVASTSTCAAGAAAAGC
jgi:hypothetical protein